MYTLTFASIQRLRTFSRSSLSLCAVLVVAGCFTTARAQMGGIDSDPGDTGTGGKNTIQGTIYYPGGRRLDKRIKVKLRSISTSEQFKMTDDNGSFIFRGLRGGTYYITIDAGKEFEQSSETVDIIEPMRRPRSLAGQTYTVQINLQPKENLVSKAGTVNAASATVPDSAINLYKEAMESARAGDNKKAVEALKNALTICPTFMLAHNELGVQYLRLNEIDKAVDSFRSALKIEPDAFVPRLNYGVALLHKKKYTDAATQLQQAVQKDGSSASAHFHLGKAYIYINSYDRAEKELQQAITLGNTEMVEAHRYLGAIYIEKRENARAAAELEKYLSLAPRAKDASQIKDLIKQLRAQAAVNKK